MKNIQAVISLALLIFANFSVGEVKIQQSVELLILTDTNTSYQIQTSSNLIDWIDSGYPFNGNGGTNAQHFSTLGKSKEYYRAVETSPANVVKIDLLSYLHPFGVWVYDSYEEGTGPASDWVTRVLGTTEKNGCPVILKQEYDESGYLNDQQFISTSMSNSLCTEIGWYNSGEGDWFWNKPLPLLMNRFVPGDSYAFPGFQRDFGDMDLTLQSYLEQVTVPAGTYDCIKVVSTFEILPPSPVAGTYIFTAWYAENIGMVKRVQEDGTIWELKRYDNFTP